MATAYSSLMGLALPVQGELSGTWGDTVNNGITNYLDVALAGTQTISGSQTAVTLSLTNGNASATNIAQAGSGATGSAQYAIINCTGNPASLLTITVPASSRQYVVINATSTSQSVKVVGAGPTTGVTIVSGEKAHIVWNGSDFVKIASTVPAAAGSNTQVQYNSSGSLAGSANLTFDGTNLTSGGTVSATKLIPTGGAATGNGMYLPASNTLAWSNNGSETMRLDASGNLGLGVTPSAWGSSIRAMQISSRAAVWGLSGNSYYSNNTFFDGTNSKYIETAFATMYSQQNDGAHKWYTAPSGTAGNAITFTQAMTLDASGNLGIGTTSPTRQLQVSNASNAIISALNGSIEGVLNATTTNVNVGSASNHFLTLSTNGTERARIDSSGNVGIGLTPVANNGILQLNSYGSVQALMEKATVSATAATGTINFDAATQAVLYYTTNASGNWTINIRGNSGLTLNSMMQTGQSLTLAFLATNGATAYYQSALTIDGSSVTPKWQGGTAPTAGNASSIDAYVLTVIKTGSATFTVLASQTKFA